MSERTEVEQRAFDRGRENAEARIQAILSAPMPAFAAPEPERDPWLPFSPGLLPEDPERRRWYRETPAGQLAAVVAPYDPAAEDRDADATDELVHRLEAARQRRGEAGMAWGPVNREQARLAASRRGESIVLSGEASEIGRAFRAAGLPFGISQVFKPLPGPASVTHQPVTRG